MDLPQADQITGGHTKHQHTANTSRTRAFGRRSFLLSKSDMTSVNADGEELTAGGGGGG